ncbi:MAG: methyltransferase domain-containing protein [Phycisphaerales bacterium]
MSQTASTERATQTARDYYNSADADNFYAIVWGGQDIHIGLYEGASEPIAAASRRTVDHMADRVADHLTKLGDKATVLDIGAGYGGAARRLVERFGCKAVCLNLSEAENERNRQLTAEAGMQDQIEVIDGSFEDIPVADGAANLVWSQDAILHSGDRPKVLQEVDRVLASGGRFVYTDPMRSDTCPEGVLQPILDRIHLSDLGSPGFYKAQANKLGWTDHGFEDLTHQLVNHYTRVLETTEELGSELEGKVSPAYTERMKKGLGHWIEGGKAGHLAWGIFHFEKP